MPTNDIDSTRGRGVFMPNLPTNQKGQTCHLTFDLILLAGKYFDSNENVNDDVSIAWWKKGRKWDDPVVRVRPKCLEAAKDIAMKINARLIAEGVLKPPEDNSAKLLENSKNDSSGQDHQLTYEIDINEIPLACRNLLTRSVTQEDISKMSGAKVSTKGRFMTPPEKIMAKLTGEKALYLCVQGSVQANVDLAVQRITSIISSTCNIPPTSLSIVSQNTPTSSYRAFLLAGSSPSLNFVPQTLAFVQDKLFIGLEHAPPSFDVKSKILGPNGMYLHHIQSETGSKVLLRGRGSGFNEPTSGREAFEPMHIYIQHSNQVGLNQARTLAQSLLHTVQQEYATFQQQLAFMPPTVSPGTASMLAGLQQQSYINPMSQMWPNNTNNNNVMYPQPQQPTPSSMLPTVYPAPPTTNSSINHTSMMSGLPPIPYTFPIDNFIPKPSVPPKRPPLLQSSPLMPLYGGHPNIGSGGPQISPFSAVQNYYKHYIQTSHCANNNNNDDYRNNESNDDGDHNREKELSSSTSTTAVPTVTTTSMSMPKNDNNNDNNNTNLKGGNVNKSEDGSHDNDGHISMTTTPRRRFHEKEEDVKVEDREEITKELKKEEEDKTIMPPPPPSLTKVLTKKSRAKSKTVVISNDVKDKDRDIMPPPPTITSLKTTSGKKRHSKIQAEGKPKISKDSKEDKDPNGGNDKKLSNSRSSESPGRPKKLKGALKSVVAYGSDSEDDDDV